MNFVTMRRVNFGTLAILAAMSVGSAGCSTAIPKQSVEAVATTLMGQRASVGPGPEDLRRLQQRDYQASKEIAFASTITTLLDLGYRIQTADIASGLIVASASSSERLRIDLGGLLNERQTPVVSAYVEERSPGWSRVRISMAIEAAGRASSGPSFKAVAQDGPYSAIFSQLSREIADRSSLHRAVAAVPLASVTPTLAAHQPDTDDPSAGDAPIPVEQ